MRSRRSRCSRRGHRTHQIMLLGLLALMPVGAAYLAQNSLPASYTGQVHVAVTPPQQSSLSVQAAKVDVAHQDTYQFTNMKATLTGPSGPVQGATIVFRVADVDVCTGTTNHNGEATCSSNEQFDRTRFHPTGADPLTYPYTATFAGDPPLAASTGTGSLQRATG